MKVKTAIVTVFSLAVFSILAIVAECPALAAEYPERPVECVVPWSVGGGGTLFCRALFPAAEKFLGQPIPIVNIPGAGGSVGWIEYMKRAADGYSFMYFVTDNIIGANLKIYKYAVEDMDFVMRGMVDHSWIAVRKDSPFKTFPELVDAAKKNPDKMKFGGIGMASNEALANAKLASMGVKMKYVSYDGGGELHAALLRGEVDLLWEEQSDITYALDSGQMRLLASATEKRLPKYNMPTLRELGYPILGPFFRGFAMKKGVNPTYRKKLADALVKATGVEEWKKFLQSKGLSAEEGVMNTEDFTKFVQDSDLYYKGVIKDTGYMGK